MTHQRARPPQPDTKPKHGGWGATCPEWESGVFEVDTTLPALPALSPLVAWLEECSHDENVPAGILGNAPIETADQFIERRAPWTPYYYD